MATTTTTSTTTTSTTQPPYSKDKDLLEIRSNIINLGIAEWQLSHYKSRDVINRDLESGWYRQACEATEQNNYNVPLIHIDYRTSPFVPARMLNWSVQLKDLSVFKTLELVYEYLSKDAEEDVFMKLSDRYKKKYDDELKRVIKAGIDYDWDADSVIDTEEVSYQRLTRRLSRV